MNLHRPLSVLAVVLLITGCSTQPTETSEETPPPAAAPSETDATPDADEGDDADESAGEETSGAATTVADSCDWDAAPISGAATGASGQEGELADVIIGAWQHTHFDDGGGFTAVDADIRYVFPEAGRILYCQHVPGITEHAENRADITWEGERMVLPGAPGYTVTAWSSDTMIWLNHADDSQYLLQRR